MFGRLQCALERAGPDAELLELVPRDLLLAGDELRQRLRVLDAVGTQVGIAADQTLDVVLRLAVTGDVDGGAIHLHTGTHARTHAHTSA